MTQMASPQHTHRLEVRTAPEERELTNQAVATTGKGLTGFVITHASAAASGALADRTEFVLNASALAAWEKINVRPA